MASVPFRQSRWTRPASIALTLALAGCGDASRDPARAAASPPSEEAERPDANAAATAPTPRASAPGVPLPLADSAPSALTHAAYLRAGDGWSPLLYLCDGIEGKRIALVTVPDANGLARLRVYRKPDLAAHDETVRLGDEDPGAGQIMREIRRPDGGAFGNVHAINSGMLGDAAATTLPTLSSITDRTETTRCRWLPRGRVLLVGARRAALVTAEPDGSYTYRSFDHDKPGRVTDAGEHGWSSTPTATVTGGRLVASAPRRAVYEFTAGPWTYRVSASADDRAPSASVTVLRDGRPAQTDAAIAYEMAAQRMP